MICSLTLAGLPIEGKNLKPHDYQQMYKKKEDVSKTWILTGKQFEDFRRKRTETLFSTFQKTSAGKQDPKAIIWCPPL